MSEGLIYIYCGDGKGKTTAAVGQAIRIASQSGTVFIVQFLKGKNPTELDFIRRLEPEIKLFTFEKNDEFYLELSAEEKKEAAANIRNGLNFAKKVLTTGECDCLVLDEALGLIDNEIATIADFQTLIKAKPENASLIMTGIHLPDEICMMADEVSRVVAVK
ncbi:MAG TPA: cob(I)yrinic acid a,c-diamide adenosyltransferase [Lachnospiraceae bacterium]|nr:cob(I)yrinic acid a,c-diamide adenosyltransferase [Lachnospiraceae bacterium]